MHPAPNRCKFNIWLATNGMSHLSELFANHAIDFDVVGSLQASDLREIGVGVGDHIRLKKALEKYYRTNAAALVGDAERRLLTVMFCDLVGSTALSQRFDPEVYRKILRSYQSVVAVEVQRFDGTVARIFGDGFMVYFGFPHARENDASRAVRTAINIVTKVADIRHPLDIDLKVRIGVATGEVVVGDMIGQDTAELSAVQGLTPNLSARLQEIAEENCIVICDTTKRLVDVKLNLEKLTPQPLKGIDGFVEASVVRGILRSTRYDVATERGVTPFAGRRNEMRALNRFYSKARSGNGQAVVVEGEAGIGKSRLVNHFVSENCPRGNCWIFSCTQLHNNSVLYPLIDHYQSIIFSNKESTVDERLFGISTRNTLDLFDDLVQLLSLKSTGPTEESTNYLDKVASLFVGILEILTRDRLCTIVVEDIHWADVPTLDLFSQVAQWAQSHRLLIVLTSRSGAANSPTRIKNFKHVPVSRLSARESMLLLQSMIGAEKLSFLTLDSIASRGDGVPLFLEELVRYTKVDQSTNCSSNRSAARLPVTLRDLLMERLDRLGDVKPVAQIAAVIGRTLSIDLLQHVDGLEDCQRAHAIDVLENAGIFNVKRSSSATTIEFRHALIQEQAYESLLFEVRPKLHLRIAKALKNSFPSVRELEPETLAFHFERGNEYFAASVYRAIAGDRARFKSVHHEAASHFVHAIKLLQLSPGNCKHLAIELELRIKLGTELIACHGNGAQEVIENFERAYELCSEDSSLRHRFEALHGLRLCYIIRGPLSRAKKLGVELLELAKKSGDLGLALQAHRPHGLCLFALGDFSGADYHLRRAIALHNPIRDGSQRFSFVSDPLVLAHCNLAWTLCFLGNSEKSSEQMTKALARANGLDHPHSLAFALSIAASVSQISGKIEDSFQYSEQVINISSEHEYPYWLAWGEMMLAWARGAMGDHASSALHLRNGIVSYLKTDAKMMLPYFYALLAEIELDNGEHQYALNSILRAEQTMKETQTEFYAPEIYRLRSVCIYTADEDRVKANEYLVKARKISVRQKNKLLLLRVESTWQMIAETGRGMSNRACMPKKRSFTGNHYDGYTPDKLCSK